MSINIGIAETHRTQLAEKLQKLVADTYTLYTNTQNVHWNVTGPLFYAVHMLTEGQYQELTEAIDDLAERIRTLGEKVPASYSDFSAVTSVPSVSHQSDAQTMIQGLVSSNEAVIQTARGILPLAQEAGDEATVDMLTSRLDVHEKAAWMLRSLIS